MSATVKIDWLRIENDPGLADAFIAMGRGANGRYVTAWGCFANNGALPPHFDKADADSGWVWFDSEEAAQRHLNEILEADAQYL